MTLPAEGIHAEPEPSIFHTPLTLNVSGFFSGLAKATGFGLAKCYDEMTASLIESLSAVGLARTNEQLAGTLLSRAIVRGTSQLLRHHLREFPEQVPKGLDAVSKEIEKQIAGDNVVLGIDFFGAPEEHPLVGKLQSHTENWLAFRKPGTLNPKTIASRFPDFFVWALHIEFQEQVFDYSQLIAAVNTPVAEAWRRSRTWEAYRRDLKRQLAAPVFGESFSLPQIFLWPAAYTVVKDGGIRKIDNSKEPLDAPIRSEDCKKQVVDLRDALDFWISGEGQSEDEQRRDAIRVISGDPGSGKSSFSKMYADHRIEQGDKVLFVPLHRLNVQGEFGSELDVFCSETDNCPTGLMNPETGVPQLLIILDGLDELSKQGAIGATIANSFVEEVLRKISARNSNKVNIRVLISGRPIAIQNVGDKFRKPDQIYTVLPYFTAKKERKGYVGRVDLLENDLRQIWWQKYGDLTGHAYSGLPDELGSSELLDLTSQPLLNLLLSIVYQHGTPTDSENAIDFSASVNRNMIYDVLLEKVYERDWDTTKSHKAIGNLEASDFKELLQEMALTAWHGTERTTTVSALREQCSGTYLEEVLENYQKRCDDGVGSLFTAFYFKKSEKTDGPEPTFEFTHKSFGEYLTALRLLDGLQEIHEQLHKNERTRVNTFSDESALVEWMRVFGPTPISNDLIPYLDNELSRRLSSQELSEQLQKTLVRLLDYSLTEGMPCEKLGGKLTFQAMSQYASNSETALMMFHSLIAKRTNVVSSVEWGSPGGADLFLNRQSMFRLARYLNHLSFDEQRFWASDFFHANLLRCSFRGAVFHFTSFVGADFRDADLSNAQFFGSRLEGADMENARMKSTRLGVIAMPIRREGAACRILTRIDSANLKNADLDLVGQVTVGIPDCLPDGSQPGPTWEQEIDDERNKFRAKEEEEADRERNM